MSAGERPQKFARLVDDVQHEELRTAVEAIMTAGCRRENCNPGNGPAWLLVNELWCILKGVVEVYETGNTEGP